MENQIPVVLSNPSSFLYFEYLAEWQAVFLSSSNYSMQTKNCNLHLSFTKVMTSTKMTVLTWHFVQVFVDMYTSRHTRWKHPLLLQHSRLGCGTAGRCWPLASCLDWPLPQRSGPSKLSFYCKVVCWLLYDERVTISNYEDCSLLS